MAGVAALGEDVDGSPITYKFCYQATASFNINFNWSFTSAPTTRPTMSLTRQEIGGSPVVATIVNPAQSGTETFTLPASTFCYVLVEASGDGGTLTTSLS